MALISSRRFRKNLGNLKDFFGQMVYRPPWQKSSRTPMPGKRLPFDPDAIDHVGHSGHKEHKLWTF